MDTVIKYQKRTHNKLRMCAERIQEDALGVMTQSFTIPGRLPDLNAYTRLNRANYNAANAAKRESQDLIMWAIKQQRVKPFATRVKISYLWVEKNMMRDLDNIAFAQKFVQDALVNSGILPGDGWKCIRGFEHDFAVDKGNPRIEVTITET